MTTPHTRSFWFSAGLVGALAASIGLSGAGTQAAPGDDESTFVPITPCRLFDFRQPPDQIGPRDTSLGAGETHLLQVTGTNGQCTIPAQAVAIAMNVTALNATAPSFLQLWPADASQPDRGSSLNYLPGQAPTPNKVDVKLSTDGAVNVYNLAGTVDVLGDVVGYYTDDGIGDMQLDLSRKANRSDVFDKQETLDLIGDVPAVADVYKTSQTFNRTQIINKITDAVDDLAAAADLEALESDVDDLTNDVAGKAAAADLDALESDVDDLTNDVAGKASAADLEALEGEVDDLTNDVAGKADAADVYAKSETYSQGEVDGLLGNVPTLDQVYDKDQQEDFFMGRDPDVVMRQGSGELRGPLGLLPLDVAGVTLNAGTSGLMELVGPAALSDAFKGRVDYELTAVDVCIDDIVGLALLDTVTVSIRDDSGDVTEVIDPTNRTASGCYTVEVTSVANAQSFYLELDAGLLGTSLGITGVETTWSPVSAP